MLSFPSLMNFGILLILFAFQLSLLSFFPFSHEQHQSLLIFHQVFELSISQMIAILL
jgi:hypothetical protein